jgi:hypothetical protein
MFAAWIFFTGSATHGAKVVAFGPAAITKEYFFHGHSDESNSNRTGTSKRFLPMRLN